MKVVYIKMSSDGDGYLCRRAGKSPFFCFDARFKGQTETVLDLIACILETEKIVYPAQPSTVNSTLWLENGQLHKFFGEGEIWPIGPELQQLPAPVLAGFCRN